ncbi:MAG: SDR family oxidoreductase [Coprococcus sp.]|nr:SDR family oxidoreductase [Coprococcus sp.]
MKRLKNKVALIAGGACGIGGADSLLFAREGAKVVIGDINEAAGKALEEQIKTEGFEATFMKLDITSEENWKQVFEATVKKYGKINICVNNAGVSLGKDICDTTLEEWNWLMNINSTGVFLGTKYAIAYMKDNKEKNSIINRSSIDGQIGEAGLCAYCASKGSVTLLTKSAALACGQRKYSIRVNSVHPGYVHTALTEKEAADSGMTPDQYFEKVGAQHPIGYIGEPMDIAYADLYLASDESIFVTGSELTIDGGWTAQ